VGPKLLQKHLQPRDRYKYGGKITLAVALKLPTSPSSVFSNRALTIRAEASLLRVTSLQLMIGVLMTLAALIISLIRGTPSVTFMDATPAKWKVLSVICVPGSPIDCAPTAPTVEPCVILTEYRNERGSYSLTWFNTCFGIFDPT
jgi:hypothetical protein